MKQGKHWKLTLKKVVQMHLLARNFASQLESKVRNAGKLEAFGEMLSYRKIFYGVIDSSEHVTIEEFVEREFIKYTNNTGLLCVEDGNILGQKAECLSHSSFEKSGRKNLLVDIQGSGTNCFDLEIASSDLCDGTEFMYCTGNLSTMAISNFIEINKCNKYCCLAGLPKLQE